MAEDQELSAENAEFIERVVPGEMDRRFLMGFRLGGAVNSLLNAARSTREGTPAGWVEAGLNADLPAGYRWGAEVRQRAREALSASPRPAGKEMAPPAPVVLGQAAIGEDGGSEWVTVPREPTEAMVAAAVEGLHLPWREIQRFMEAYRRMIAAFADGALERQDRSVHADPSLSQPPCRPAQEVEEAPNTQTDGEGS